MKNWKLVPALILFGLIGCGAPAPQEEAAAPAEEAPAMAHEASPAAGRGQADVSVAGKSVSIDYGRPELKGRDMLSQAQAGMVWRLGMNEATTITSDGTLVLGDKELAPGTYTLFAKKVDETTWHLLVNSQTGMWGSADYDSAKDVAEVPLEVGSPDEPVEVFTIALDPVGESSVALNMTWGTTKLSCNFDVK